MDMSELVLLGVVIIAFLLMIFGRKCTVCDSRLTIITSKVEEDSSGLPVGHLNTHRRCLRCGEERVVASSTTSPR